MIKKVLIMLVLATIMISASSCKNEAGTQKEAGTEKVNDSVTDSATESKEEPAPANESAFICEFADGKTITLGAKAEDVIPSLGDYVDFMEAPSCVHEGNDKIYTYDGFTVMTSPNASGDEYIAEIEITSDACVLKNSITIGSKKDDVISAYGSDFTEQFGIMTFDLENVSITVITDADELSGIVFSATN